MRTSLIILGLAALASVGSSQCLEESWQYLPGTGASDRGGLLAVSADRVAFTYTNSSGLDFADCHVLNADGSVANIVSSFGFNGGPSELDVSGTRWAYALQSTAGAFASVVETGGTNAFVFNAIYPLGTEVHVTLTENSGGEWVVVGLPQRGVSGEVEVWNRPSGSALNAPWTLVTTLTAPAANSAGMRFGASVSMDGDTLAISSPLGDQGAVDGGHFYAYRWNGTSWGWNSWWVGGNAGEQRHSVVKVSGDVILCGAPDADNGGTDAGSVTFFRYDGSIYAPGAFWFVNSPGARWGSALAIDGDYAIVGSENGSFAFPATWNGSFYDIDGSQIINAPGPGAGFGQAVGVVAGATPRYYVGHPGFDGGEGAIHRYVIGATTSATDVGNGLAGAFGVPVLASDTCNLSTDLTLTTSGMPIGSTFAIVIGLSTINSPFKGGTLVPSPDLLVSGLPTAAGTLPVAGTIPAGLDGFAFFFQSWIADGAGPNGFSASNGLRIDFLQ